MKPDKQDPRFLKIVNLHHETVLPPEKDRQILKALKNAKEQSAPAVFFAVKYALPALSLSAAVLIIGIFYFYSNSSKPANTFLFESETGFSALNISRPPKTKNIPPVKLPSSNLKTVKYAWNPKSSNPKVAKTFKTGSTLNFDDKVAAKILKTAQVAKISPYRYKQLSGSVFYKVSHITSALPVRIEAGNGIVRIVGTEFILKVEKSFSELNLKKGKVIITENGKKHILTAGNSLKWSNKRKITEKEIFAVLKKYKKQGKHLKAIKYINSVLPSVSSGLKESLILDKIGIKAALLNKWDDACNDLKSYLARYKNGKYRKSALFLWNRYRCTK